MESLSQQLAEFAHDLVSEALPDDVVEHVRWRRFLSDEQNDTLDTSRGQRSGRHMVTRERVRVFTRPG